jgi:heptosyltransferase-2
MAGRSEQATRPPRVLVVGVNWLGDTVMALPALAALRETIPEQVIHVGVPSHLAPLVRLAPFAHEVWGWPEGASTFHRVRLARRGEYDRVILFPNSFRSAWIAWLARIPERWGYDGHWRRWLLNRPIPRSKRPGGVHQSQSYLEIIRALGWRGSRRPEVRLGLPPSLLQWARDALAPAGRGRPVVGICPGAAYGPAKRWPPERFVELARALRDRHGAAVVLMGSRAEQGFIGQMASAIGAGALDLSGATDLERLAAVLAMCRLVVSNDSGPMHLAAALGTPVLALFGSTDPVATAPLGPHRIVRAAVPCSPCLRRDCPDGRFQCLTRISPQQVLAAAEELLRDEATPRSLGP